MCGFLDRRLLVLRRLLYTYPEYSGGDESDDHACLEGELRADVLPEPTAQYATRGGDNGSECADCSEDCRPFLRREYVGDEGVPTGPPASIPLPPIAMAAPLNILTAK